MNRGAAKHGKQDNATHTTSRQVPRGEMRWTLIREGRNRCTVIGGKRERERRRSMRRRMRDFHNQKALLAATPMSMHLLEQNAHQNHIFRSPEKLECAHVRQCQTDPRDSRVLKTNQCCLPTLELTAKQMNQHVGGRGGLGNSRRSGGVPLTN